MKYIYYLSAFNRGLFNSYYCYGLFLPFEETFKCYNKFLYLYIFLNKIFLSTNIRNICVKRKINRYYFDVMKNDQIFSSKVYHFQYDNRFLFRREIENVRRIQIARITFALAFFKMLKMENYLGETFSFPFPAKCFNKNFAISLCHKVQKIGNRLKVIFFITFSNNKLRKRNLF